MTELASRSSMLKEVLEVEAEIKKIKLDPVYRNILSNLKRLKRTRFRRSVIKIPSPIDLNKNLELRRNSKEMKEIMQKYEERRMEYNKKIEVLRKRRENLINQMFS